MNKAKKVMTKIPKCDKMAIKCLKRLQTIGVEGIETKFIASLSVSNWCQNHLWTGLWFGCIAGLTSLVNLQHYWFGQLGQLLGQFEVLLTGLVSFLSTGLGFRAV